MFSSNLSWKLCALIAVISHLVLSINAMDQCSNPYVNVDTSNITELHCSGTQRYGFNDGGSLNSHLAFYDGIFHVSFPEKSFLLRDESKCPLVDKSSHVKSVTLLVAPSFEDTVGSGIQVDADHLWGAVILHTSVDEETKTGSDPKDTGRIIFPLEKTNGVSDISEETAEKLATINSKLDLNSDEMNNARADIKTAELHRLGDVGASKNTHAYLYYETVVKLYLDVPIKITQQVYNTLKGSNTPVPVKSTQCYSVYRMNANGASNESMLLSKFLIFFALLNLAYLMN